ncbi:MAG: FtsH protease activity modulator HflK [Proteobacteria bacterium]|nr:FtsH protease activity modulator HflK [Pseudomonadota bacterium]
MPWSNQSGGGNDGRGPWGSGGGRGGSGGGSGGQPPDFEDLIRKGQERVRGMIPGGGASPTVLALLVALALVGWLATGIYRVEAGQQGVTLVFGKVVNPAIPAGLHYNWPAPIGEVLTPQVDELRRVDIGFRGAANSTSGRSSDREVPEESLMLTSDQNIVDVDLTVFWQIKNAGDYLFNIRGQEATVKIAAESALREIVGQTRFDQAVTAGREEIQQRTMALLQQILDQYDAGIIIGNVQLQKSDPPPEVIDAFNDVQRARQDKERLQNEADAYANSIVPVARGLAEKDIRSAEAYREQQIQEAQGDADRFNSVYDAYKVAPEVTRRRMYLETMGAVMGSARKVIIDQNAGGSGVVPYLPLPEIQNRQAPKNAQPSN